MTIENATKQFKVIKYFIDKVTMVIFNGKSMTEEEFLKLSEDVKRRKGKKESLEEHSDDLDEEDYEFFSLPT